MDFVWRQYNLFQGLALLFSPWFSVRIYSLQIQHFQLYTDRTRPTFRTLFRADKVQPQNKNAAAKYTMLDLTKDYRLVKKPRHKKHHRHSTRSRARGGFERG